MNVTKIIVYLPTSVTDKIEVRVTLDKMLTDSDNYWFDDEFYDNCSDE